MASLGSVLLALAFLAAVGAAVVALAGRNGERRWIDLSRRTVYAFCALLTACVVIIEVAFAGNDFSFNIVQQHSSIETPVFYKLAAMWSSQEGSLLLWAWVLSIASSLALYATRNRLREIVPWATAVMMGVAAFFTGLMLFAPDVDPFRGQRFLEGAAVGLGGDHHHRLVVDQARAEIAGDRLVEEGLVLVELDRVLGCRRGLLRLGVHRLTRVDNRRVVLRIGHMPSSCG